MIARYIVHGVVQGVGYRAFVRSCAMELGVVGTVRNQDDGSVLVVAEGSNDILERFEKSIDVSQKHGIQVMNMEKEYMQGSTGLDGFRVEE